MISNRLTTDIIAVPINHDSLGDVKGNTVVDRQLEHGCIVGLTAHVQGCDTDGMIRVEITNDSGTTIVKNIPLDALRMRNTHLEGAYYPLDVDAGRMKLTVKVSSSERFSSSGTIDFVFWYQRNN
jgi:hypothetical protein